MVTVANEIALSLVRKLSAPVEKVYAAWTDPALMSRWMAPGEAVCIEARTVLEVGGEFYLHMRNPDGEDHVTSGTFQEVVPLERLVFTWQWQTSENQTLVTVAFRALDAGTTELTLTHARFPDEEVRDKHEGGWNPCLDKLEAWLAA